MKIEEANKILHEYGIILEIGSSTATAIQETFLFHPINEIKKAIKIALLVEKDLAQIELLKWSYVCLAKFVSLDEAQIVFRFEKYATEKVLLNKIDNSDGQMLQFRKKLPRR